jgi:hypothetical protein
MCLRLYCREVGVVEFLYLAWVIQGQFGSRGFMLNRLVIYATW